jgi:hypothetical protein
MCQGKAQETWSQKMKICRKCEVFIGHRKRVRSSSPNQITRVGPGKE